MRAQAVVEAINRLTVERGEKRNKYYYVTLSCKDVLNYMGEELIKGNLRFVAYIAIKGYPESTLAGKPGDFGQTLNIKIRYK